MTVIVTVDGLVVNKVSGSMLDALPDGEHKVRVEATNAAGTGFAEVTFTVDTVAPTVSISSPVSGASKNRTPTLTYSVSDGRVVVMVDGYAVTMESGQALSALPDGLHTVQVKATDAAGNRGSAQVSFVVDNTPPTIYIESPVEGLVNVTSVPVIYGASDGVVTVTVDGGAMSLASGSTLQGLGNGSHTIIVSSTDTAGNTGSASVTFMVDTAAIGNDDENIYCSGTGTYVVGPSSFTSGIYVPTTGNDVLIASPANGSTITGSKIIVKGAMDTTVPVNSVMIVVSSGTSTAGYLAQVNGKYFAAKVPVSADTTTITAIATDQTGTRHQASVSVSVTTQSDFVDLLATPGTGLLVQKESAPASLDVSLSSTPSTTHAITYYAWDFDGSGGSEDLKCYSHNNVTASYQQTGLYLTKVSVKDTTGSSYTDTAVVNVIDPEELNGRIIPIWNEMKTALLAGNIEGALTYFTGPGKEKYSQMFATAGSTNIGLIFTNITELRLNTIYGPVAEYWALRQEAQGTFAYPVTFVRDGNGNWKILGF